MPIVVSLIFNIVGLDDLKEIRAKRSNYSHNS